MKKILPSLVVTYLFIAASVTGKKNLGKPFGFVVGTAFIGGRDYLDDAGMKLEQDIYTQFINYKRLMQLNILDDELYYSRFTETNQCIGACPRYSYCKQGICFCNTEASVVQIYGRCFGNQAASFVGDHDKYRKPIPLPRPEWCFCKKKNGGKTVWDQHRNNEIRKVVTYPNNFDHNTQMCRRGDHAHCLGRDINMFCGEKTIWDPRDGIEKNVCQCRKDMKFDTRLMECRLFIDVDCTNESASGDVEESLTKLLKGQLEEPDKEYSQKEIKSAFCSLLEAELPIKTAVDDVLIYIGVSIAALLIVMGVVFIMI